MKYLFDVLEFLGHLLKPRPGRSCLGSLALNAMIMLGVLALAALVLLGCIWATG